MEREFFLKEKWRTSFLYIKCLNILIYVFYVKSMFNLIRTFGQLCSS